MVEEHKRSPLAHVRVVFSVLAVVLVVALTARRLAYPDSYGEFGHYRGKAVEQAMNLIPPLHVGREACAECHDDIAKVHARDVHRSIDCENCHGPGRSHIDEQKETKTSRPDAKPVHIGKTVEDCLVCHRRLVARPASFPQIDVAEHFRMLHVADPQTACTKCHDAHRPMFADTPVDAARLHPVINECVDCHKHEQDRTLAKPDKHPVIFECAYCHAEISKDFATRKHAAFRCGTCHQYYPVSERGGRILKHTDPQFCLLCHSDKVKKDAKGPPAISWPQHRADMADNAAKDANKVCVDCHRDAFHLPPAALGAKPAKGAAP